MAASMSRLGFTVLRSTLRIPAQRRCLPLICPNRTFITTPPHRRRQDQRDSASQTPQPEPFKFSLSDLDADERAAYNSLSPEEREQWREEAKQMHDYMTSPQVESELQGVVSQAVHETSKELPPGDTAIRRTKPGFFASGEIDVQDTGEDEEFEGDDITSLGHGELEQHREMRHYARIAAWEMPLLSSTLCSSLSPPPPNQRLQS